MRLNLIPDKGKSSDSERPQPKPRSRSRRSRRSLVIPVIVLISSTLWLVTALNDPSNSTVEVVFPVKYANLSSEYAFEMEPPKEIKAQIDVNGISLLRYSLKPRGDSITHFVTKTDISGESFEVSELLMQERVKEKIGSNAKIRWIKPSSISIPFYKRSSKSVPVEDKILTDVRSGYVVSSIRLEPSKMKVFGAKTLLDRITLINTAEISLRDLHETLEVNIPLEVPSGVTLSQDSIHAVIEVEALTERTFSMPVIPINLPEGMRLRPLPAMVEVRIVIPTSQYTLFNAEDFRTIIDYNDIRQSEEEASGDLLNVEMDRLPHGISRYKISPSRVQYILEREENKK